MAYDTATSQLVLFGGYNGSYLNDTWTWNDTTTLGPSQPRHQPFGPLGAPMAYDPANGGQLLLFGGGGASSNYNDTWDWNGATWGQLAPTSSPGTRSVLTISYERPPTRWSSSAATTPAPSATPGSWAPQRHIPQHRVGPGDRNTSVTITGTGFAGWQPPEPSTSARRRRPPTPSPRPPRSPPAPRPRRPAPSTSPSPAVPAPAPRRAPTSSPTPIHLVPGRPDHPPDGARWIGGGLRPGHGPDDLVRGTSGTWLNDTWNWNGANWVQLSPAASPQRALAPRWPTTRP